MQKLDPNKRTEILKVAERCNLNCSYCYMYNHPDQSYKGRPKFMSEEVYTRALLMMRNYCENHAPARVSLSFHGGEPTLLGPDRFDDWVSRARTILGDRLDGISLQTNATLLNERWVPVLQKHPISVGVSMDGPAEVHDRFRVDFRGAGSHLRVMEGIELLNRNRIPYLVLCVINPFVSGLEVYRFFRARGISRIDLLLPDVTHDSVHTMRPEGVATPVADYLIPVFDAWLEENDPEVTIRLFWGIVRNMMGGSRWTDAFGNPRLRYLVIESDGAIEGNDVLKICEEGMAATGLNVLEDSFDDLATAPGIVRTMVFDGIPLCHTCRRCPEVEFCGGGYLPHRYSSRNGFDNPSVWCEDIQKLFGHIRARCARELPVAG
jgi:uncharacterized protein